MSWLDIVILVILALATLGGFFVGLIRTVIPLAGLILGIILAGRLYTPVSAWFSFVHSDSGAKAIAFILIFAVVLVIAALVAWGLSKAIEAVRLGWMNRVLGAAFGLFFGAIFISAILALWVKFFGANSAMSGSALASFLVDRFGLVLALLPGDFSGVRSFFR